MKNPDKIFLNTFLKKPIVDFGSRDSYSEDFFDYKKIWALGFPYPQITKDLIADFYSLNDAPVQSLFSDYAERIVSSSPIYSKLANCFFPNLYRVKVEGFVTPYDAFYDPKRLKIALWLSYDGHKEDGERSTNPKVSKLRISLMQTSGVQAATNFRPSSAKCIYDFFGNGLKIFDYSAGFGGRLLGFMASTGSEYVAVDVNKDNFSKYESLIKHFLVCEDLPKEGNLAVALRGRVQSLFATDKILKIYESGSEDFKNKEYEGYFDLSFSSPPYFSKEVYSSDPSQCFNKFSSFDLWKKHYWEETLRNQFYLLKPGGILGINIEDVKIKNTLYPLVEVTKNLCISIGFQEDNFLFYEHAKTPFSFSQGGENFAEDRHTEPILIYRKPKEI